MIRELERAGWVQIRQAGSHGHFTHPARSGAVCVSGGMGKEMPKGTLANIVRQAGLDLRSR